MQQNQVPLTTAPTANPVNIEAKAVVTPIESPIGTKRTLASIRCPVELTIRVIGGKWKPVILWHLREDKKRFGELKRQIKGITVKMLAQQLRELEKDGIIVRKMFYEVPPRVEYSLSDLGRELDPVLNEMYKWGITFQTKIGFTPGAEGKEAIC